MPSLERLGENRLGRRSTSCSSTTKWIMVGQINRARPHPEAHPTRPFPEEEAPAPRQVPLLPSGFEVSGSVLGRSDRHAPFQPPQQRDGGEPGEEERPARPRHRARRELGALAACGEQGAGRLLVRRRPRVASPRRRRGRGRPALGASNQGMPARLRGPVRGAGARILCPTHRSGSISSAVLAPCAVSTRSPSATPQSTARSSTRASRGSCGVAAARARASVASVSLHNVA